MGCVGAAATVGVVICDVYRCCPYAAFSNAAGLSVTAVSRVLNCAHTMEKVLVKLFMCEFQKISNGQYFGHSVHTTREAAEEHALNELLRLGVEESLARATVEAAGYGCADTGYNGYGVRIFEQH